MAGTPMAANCFLLRASLVAVSCVSAACAVVPQNRRAKLADPMMEAPDDRLDAHRQRKLYESREAAAGGDGKTAGGGCACD